MGSTEALAASHSENEHLDVCAYDKERVNAALSSSS